MIKNVVLLTGSELRHDFFRKFLGNHEHINILATYCESKKGNLAELVKKEEQPNDLRMLHLSTRTVIENDFFSLFCQHIQDQSNPIFIEKGAINEPHHVQNIIELNPDIIISYGCSIIRSALLKVFQKRFVNIHLGLSPYYRGSGTNFWPFVNNELQFVGTTFMHIDHGVDTGEIIHQIRAQISFNDNIHQIGNRLIRDSFVECVQLVKHFDELKKMPQITLEKEQERYYRKKDFTEAALEQAYLNLSNDSVKYYLETKASTDLQFPIIKNPVI